MLIPNNPFFVFLKSQHLKEHPITYLLENKNEQQRAWLFTLETNNPIYLRVILESERPLANKSTCLYLVHSQYVSIFRNELKKVYEINEFNSRGVFPWGNSKAGMRNYGGIKVFNIVHANFNKWKEQIDARFISELYIY